ncbi:uncharacterized protein JCM15063_001183 [Sporobolomyces koalae]|uniref:uncharacterized protein n=1 Tax=Sporobolomyces koalae TaxID=500713 RepID=UPI00316DCD9C
MDSESELPDKKKRRVTKACDQCRKRRIKCASYPNVPLDAPCVICTEANQAAACTYTRPTRKRGPQAGKSKTLQDKVEAFERLLGHLLVTIPAVGPHIDVFFRASMADSPESLSPSSSTSGAQPTTIEQQLNAYRSSALDQKIEAVAPAPAPVPAPAGTPNSATKPKPAAPPSTKREAPSPALSSNASLPTRSPRFGDVLPQPPPTFLQSDTFSSPHVASSSQLPSSYSFAASFDLPTDALHALARAAVPDGEQAMEGVVNSHVALPSSTPITARAGALEIPLLPSESIRNQLLDLYFNQVVQPYFPMLDKTLFLRWSAHLPSVPTDASTAQPSSRLIAPSLYLAVFALSSSYLPAAVAPSTHLPAVWAQAARAHLWAEIDKTPSLETVQATIIGVIIDWGAGEMNRAWIMSSIAVALSINLELHLASRAQPDPNSLKLKTFHSALILHTLLSLRLSRAPLVVLEDYNVPIPPVDGNEDFELWRADKTPTELREDWNVAGKSSIDSPQQFSTPARAPQAVRSASLSTFARMVSLCAIGLAILRWDVCPRRGYGQSLANGEQERVELVESLKGWQNELENELKLGDKGGGVERLEQRARWTVEMHLVLASLNLKLRPHPSLSTTAYDPVPSALVLLHHVLNRYRALYTMYRSLPIIDFPLHMFSATLFHQSDYAPHQHDTPLKAYEELSKLFPVSRSALEDLRTKVDGHKRELGLLRGVHPTASTLPPPSSPTSATVALSEPFQAFLSYSADLGPSATPSTVLDFGSWDQTDLLFSLGLVGNPNESVTGWGLPGNQDPELELPPLIEAEFQSLEEGGTRPDRTSGGGTDPFEPNGTTPRGTGLIDFSTSNRTRDPESTSSSNPTIPLHHFDASMFGSLPHVHPISSSSSFQPHDAQNVYDPPHYPSAHFFSEPIASTSTSMGSTAGAGGAGSNHLGTEDRSTDLLTRWLGRGTSLSLEGLTQTEER